MKQKTFTLAKNKHCKGNVFVVLSITTSYTTWLTLLTWNKNMMPHLWSLYWFLSNSSDSVTEYPLYWWSKLGHLNCNLSFFTQNLFLSLNPKFFITKHTKNTIKTCNFCVKAVLETGRLMTKIWAYLIGNQC